MNSKVNKKKYYEKSLGKFAVYFFKLWRVIYPPTSWPGKVTDSHTVFLFVYGV